MSTNNNAPEGTNSSTGTDIDSIMSDIANQVADSSASAQPNQQVGAPPAGNPQTTPVGEPNKQPVTQQVADMGAAPGTGGGNSQASGGKATESPSPLLAQLAQLGMITAPTAQQPQKPETPAIEAYGDDEIGIRARHLAQGMTNPTPVDVFRKAAAAEHKLEALQAQFDEQAQIIEALVPTFDEQSTKNEVARRLQTQFPNLPADQLAELVEGGVARARVRHETAVQTAMKDMRARADQVRTNLSEAQRKQAERREVYRRELLKRTEGDALLAESILQAADKDPNASFDLLQTRGRENAESLFITHLTRNPALLQRHRDKILPLLLQDQALVDRVVIHRAEQAQKIAPGSTAPISPERADRALAGAQNTPATTFSRRPFLPTQSNGQQQPRANAQDLLDNAIEEAMKVATGGVR